MNKLNILCIGGDARFIYMCSYLSMKYNVYAYGTQEATDGTVTICSPKEMPVKADVLVLPMLNCISEENGSLLLPCRDGNIGIGEIIPYLNNGAIIAGGLVSEKAASFFHNVGYEVTDYFKRRELVVKNCIPTAEGALMIAMRERNETVYGSTVLITGFGNVAKAAAKLFSACGAEVTCAVRRKDAAAEAECAGYRSADISDPKVYADGNGIIINTVPALVINAGILEKLNISTLLIDLASKPGGIDFAAAEKLGIKCFHALALPGKVAPVTAGRYIAETVENIISERRG